METNQPPNEDWHITTRTLGKAEATREGAEAILTTIIVVATNTEEMAATGMVEEGGGTERKVEVPHAMGWIIRSGLQQEGQ